MLGEGAAFLVLERRDRAKVRGAEPVAELAGWATGAEAHHITNPAPDATVVADLIARAIARAGLLPSDVDYVSAHGTGTPLNDAMEAAALARAFGREIERIPVSSSKGQIGHTLGAAGAIGAAIASLAVSRGKLVPTAGLDEPDPALGLVHVPHVGRDAGKVRAVVSNAFGFGGMDAVLVFAAPELATRRAGEGMTSGSRGPTPVAVDETLVVTGVAIFGRRGLLGVRDCARITESASAVAAIDPDAHLDVARARRLDEAGRFAAVAVQHALAEAGADPHGAGAVLGSAFGNVDASASFLRRIFDKGPRSAGPAEFPNLVPSSPVGHVSIYLGMHGPAFAAADLSLSGESAFAEAVQFVRSGEAGPMVAGAVELGSDIVDRVLSPLFADVPAKSGASRSDLAAAVVIEREGDTSAGKRALARIALAVQWRHDAGRSLVDALRGPRDERAEVVMARADANSDEVLRDTGWDRCPRILCEPALGESDALGAAALAVGAARVAAGAAREVLVLGLARGRGYAVVLAAP